MTSSKSFHSYLAKTGGFSLLSLFLVPVISLIFVLHAQSRWDADFIETVAKDIEQSTRLSAVEKQQAREFFDTNPPSKVCSNAAPDVQEYRADVCAPYSDVWQFYMAEKISWGTIAASGGVLLGILVLGALSFINRRMQYASFVAGWRMLTFASALEIIVQGALLVWLSFWLPAFFTQKYSPKLVILIGICAAMMIFYVVVCIFRRPQRNNVVEGELVAERDAPELWLRIRELAAKLDTAPPDQIIAGIDSNFFVTESALTVARTKVTGRSLFVSIPLLRILDQSEADAILAHELAHFQGGDTASSAALGPKLVQYDHYCNQICNELKGGAAIVIYPLWMYRTIFELALKRDSREREFLADRVAAKLTAGSAIVHSLIKVAAYTSYRSHIERKLFAYDRQHGNTLGLAHFIASGLAPYAMSTQFLESVRVIEIPHPYDSHPLLVERMNNVGHHVGEQDYGEIVSRLPQHTWVNHIQSADGIEQRLWASYEEQFAADHERNLAYRYQPQNEAEEAIVLKYFPPVVFQLKNNQTIQITYAGLILPEQTEIMPWDRISKYGYINGIGRDVLQIEHPEKKLGMHKGTNVKLPGIKKEREHFQNMFGYYWQRHLIMKQWMAEESVQQPAEAA